MFDVRHPSQEDIPDLLEIEFDRYKELYRSAPHKKVEVEARFHKRIEIAGDWMWVLEHDGRAVGFISGMPTNQEPEDFQSWEESTNNGTLEGKLIPTGKNVYVVNLDVSRLAAKKNGQYLLMAALGARAIREGKAKVVFESRMPGFAEWVKKTKKMNKKQWDASSPKQKQKLAEAYASFTTMVDGKEVLYDRLLRFYENSGFTFIKVYPNAFEDVESLNFGVLCVGHNPVPKSLRILPINLFSSWLFRLLGRKQKLFEKLVG